MLPNMKGIPEACFWDMYRDVRSKNYEKPRNLVLPKEEHLALEQQIQIVSLERKRVGRHVAEHHPL
jgi:hypothetical protein